MDLYSRLHRGLVLLSWALAVPLVAQSGPTPYDLVDSFIGTANGGDTFPGASLPFGMIQWSPDTNTDAWYRYTEKKIYGFSLTHLSGGGCPIYGDFAVLPTSDELKTSPGADFAPYAAAYDHRREQAHPGFYALTMANGTRVEISVSERAGIARFIFPRGSSSRVLVNAGSSANTIFHAEENRPDRDAYGNRIELGKNNSFRGSVTAGGICGFPMKYTLYVAGRFNMNYNRSAVWHDDTVVPSGKGAQGKHTGAWFDFGNSPEVLLKVGISYVSEANALNNLNREIPGWSFDRVRADAREKWSRALDRIMLRGGVADQRKIFYTGLYHSLLAPTIFSDVDGSYIGFDNEVHSLSQSAQKAQYANFSDWDIYRNTVQLQSLLDAGREGDMMQSLVNDAQQSGWLPRWPAANDVTYTMGGDSPTIVVASSYAFGAHNFDVETALKFMVKAGSVPGIGPHGDSERPFLADYRKLGYVTAEEDRISASRTLEYANSDFAIAQFAKSNGHRSEYQALLKQSENWKNLLDPETQWIRPRNADGTWLAGFDAERSLPKRFETQPTTDQYGFEEGNTYQYSFMVPYDYPALFSAMGGDDKVEARLDKFFSKLICWGEPCFNMANEPDFVTPYAYVFAGRPWKAQDVITRIEQETFRATPDGLPGNDDLGATSGVYLWNALGLYPAVPGVGGLVLGTPMFDKATLKLAGGRTLEISRRGNGIYVQKVALDGLDYTSSWLPVDKLHSGTTTLLFIMDQVPNKERGYSIGDRPPSFR